MLLKTVVFTIKVPKILIFSALLHSPFSLILRKNMAKYGILFLRKNEGKRHEFTKRIGTVAKTIRRASPIAAGILWRQFLWIIKERKFPDPKERKEGNISTFCLRWKNPYFQ